MSPAYLLEILALELRDQGGETLIISLNSDGRENGLDILLRGRGLVADGQEEVSCEVLHLDCYRESRQYQLRQSKGLLIRNQDPGRTYI